MKVSTTGKRTSEVLMGRISYRPEQATLIEDVDSPSLAPRPPEKNRALLTLLTTENAGETAKGNGTLAERVADLAGIGRGEHSDLSTNKAHLNDFGR